MAIEIYFGGLICHSGNNSSPTGDRITKTHAILVSDDDHTTYITTSVDGDIKTIRSPTSIVFSQPYGARATNEAFNRCVPHLADLSATDAVLLFGNGPDIQLPAGTFYVASYFDQGAIYTLNSEITSRACVAEFTLLETDEDTITIRIDGTELILKDDDWVFIENASNANPPNEGDHWAKFTKLLGGSHKLAKYKHDGDKKDCPPINQGDNFDKLSTVSQDRKTPRAAASSECSNSQWP
jgi:hypothetical protein